MNLSLEEFCALSAEESLEKLESNFQGLSDKKAEDKLKIFGYNEIKQGRKKSLFKKILEALIEPIVIILIIASVFSFFIGDIIEAFAILGVVIINTIISLVQDGKAEKAVEELKKILSPQFKVIRKNLIEIIASKFIVPGDIIVFEAGDIIPSDGRIIESSGLLVDEAHLTGESEAVQKDSMIVLKKNPGLYEMNNIVFAGSRILNGIGKAVVVKTGSFTEMGKIAGNITKAVEEKTPLQKRLAVETKFLVLLAFLSAVLVTIVCLIRNFKINDIVLIAISIMVAVFPEGLPASITIALSLAVERLAKNSVIIKKLSSVETLGNVDYICTDKTGTITQHNMTVKEVFLGDKFHNTADIFKMIADGETHVLNDIFLTSIKCSSAIVVEEDGNLIKEIGDPTEIALIKMSILTGFKPAQFDLYQIIDSIPFSSELMYSAILIEKPDGDREILIKGAPEKILSMCEMFYYNGKEENMNESRREAILKELYSSIREGLPSDRIHKEDY